MSRQDVSNLPSSKRVKFDSALSQGSSSSPALQTMEGSRDIEREVSEEEEEEEDEDMVTQVNQFFTELSSEQGRKKRRLIESGSNLPRRKSVLPSHLSQVMGNANLRLAMGDRAGAIELCMEIIRQAPHASEPYLALATIYEDLGYDEKLLGILMIASHLKRSDCDMWMKTSNLAVKLKDLKIAIHCISKAVKLAPTNTSLLWRKATLLSELNEPRKALETLQILVNTLPSSMGAQYVEVMKEMSRIHHTLQETPQAISLLGQLLTSHHDLVDEEVVNILAELCIITKAYEQAYEVITDYYSMITQLPDEEPISVSTPPVDHVTTNKNSSTTLEDHVTSPDTSTTPAYSLMTTLRMSIAGEDVEGPVQGLLGEEPPPQPLAQGRLHIPEEVPVDLRVKLAVSMIHLGFNLPDELLQPVFYSPEDYGDLFMDITDALTECGEHAKALPLYTALVNTRKYSQAGVWLKMAECQHILGDLEASAMAYSKVISLAPHHTDSRLRLATLYVQLGQSDDALILLESEPGTEERENGTSYHGDVGSGIPDVPLPREIRIKDKCTQDTRVVLHRYNLYMSKGDVVAYSRAGTDLLAFLFRDYYSRAEVKEMVQMKKIRVKLGMDPEKVKTSSETKREEKELESLLSTEEWYQTYVQTCTGLLTMGHAHYSTIVHLIYCACLAKKFSGDLLYKRFHFFSVSISLLIQDYETAFVLLKNIGNNYPECKHLWNIMNTLPLDSKVYKFILRLCFKNQTNPYLSRILSSHNQTNGSYRFALNQYVTSYNKQSGLGDKYILSLCIAIIFINMCCQSRTTPTGRNVTVTQASAFLHTYLKLRGQCQETNYNLGRAFHQLGVLHMACHFYKQALAMEPECAHPKWRDASDLRGEAGFNLSLIYRTSGNDTLALHILRTYCRI